MSHGLTSILCGGRDKDGLTAGCSRSRRFQVKKPLKAASAIHRSTSRRPSNGWPLGSIGTILYRNNSKTAGAGHRDNGSSTAQCRPGPISLVEFAV